MDDKEFLKKIGENIVLFRKKAGVKQLELAEKVEIDRITLYRMETGKTKVVNILTLKKISEKLGVPFHKLVKVD